MVQHQDAGANMVFIRRGAAQAKRNARRVTIASRARAVPRPSELRFMTSGFGTEPRISPK